MQPLAGWWTQQQWALIRRTWIKMRRRPIISLFWAFIVPTLMLGDRTFSIRHSGKSNYNIMKVIKVLSIESDMCLLNFPNVWATGHYLVADKASGMKSLMISMGLSRLNYYCSMSVPLIMLNLPVNLLFATIIKLYLLDQTVSYLTILSLFTLFTFQLDAALAASVSFITSTKFVVIAVIIIAESYDFFEQFLCKIGLSGDSSSPVVLFFASSSPYAVISCFFYTYARDHNLPDPENKYLPQETYLLFAAQIFWTVFFRLFAYWFEEVCPWQKYTSPRGVCFCIDRRINFKSKDKLDSTLELVSSLGNKYFERRSSKTADIGIEARNITKSFGGVDVAVNDVSFTIYKGETTLLLGHNGAGKSTLMNIILGLLEPDDGYVEFKNRSGDIVQAVGVCPQTSILDNDLTVKEHLELFNDIKSNITGNERVRHIYQTIDDVSLVGQESKRSKELSGGMKRKLSLALAFVGQSDVLILDEPSSGLDPDSRMSIWNAIRRYRSERTVLLSTQHMEEADYLGDRVAIMSAGRIVCCGSSVYLNKIFGTGYKLRLECRLSRRKQIFKHIREHYFDAVQPIEGSIDPLVRTNADPFIDYVLELTTVNKNKDPELELIRLLEDLENNAESLSVRSYGLKSSSIEDVMLNTGKYFAPPIDPNGQKTGRLPKVGQFATILGNRNKSLVPSLELLRALMTKHRQVLRVKWFFVATQRVLLPIFGIYLLTSSVKDSSITSLWRDMAKLVSALIVAHLMYFPTREYGSKFKIMQLTSHANVGIYWLAQILADLVWLSIPMIALGCLVSIWRYVSLIGSWQLLCLVSMALLGFYLAAMSFCYCLSFLVDPKVAVDAFYLVSSGSSLLSGVIYIIVDLILKRDSSSVLTIIGYTGILLYPTDAFAYIFAGLRRKCYVRMANAIGECEPYSGPSPVLVGLACLVFQIALYSTLLFLIERRSINLEWYCRLKNILAFIGWHKVDGGAANGEIDQDVVSEAAEAKMAIVNVNNSSHSLVAAQLNKSYIKYVKIIDDLSFTVKVGECFGLLGVNGAGKTTTFSMLATESRPDSGRILANGYYEDGNVHDYRKGFGYDPQATPRLSLTPYQALSLIARLRGVDDSSISHMVEAVLELLEHGHKPDGKLSGGTKRKLALGMALIGNPAILVLDEPTTGVDPLARRNVWHLLKSLREHNASSIVISSHAMEECEAICDRIAIMARGRLRCIGTFLHLRSKFAKGCTLRVQSMTDKLIDELQQQLAAAIGASVLALADKSVNSATFNITDNRVRRSILFCTMREFRQKHPNVSYMFNDSSLEDIFVSLAREQEDVDKRKEQS